MSVRCTARAHLVLLRGGSCSSAAAAAAANDRDRGERLSSVRRARAARKGEEFDEEADAEIVRQVEEIQEKGSLALVASGAVTDDSIIAPRDTRTIVGLCLSVVRTRPIEGAHNYGVFRL